MPNNNKQSKLPSVLKGGYNAAVMKRIEAIQLPDKLRCDTCKKPKTPAVSFSKKQILNIKNGIVSGRIKEKDVALPLWITCINCTPKSRTELVCVQCQTWKDLEGFTKVQRRDGDEAVCKTCIYEIENSGPIVPTNVEGLRAMHDEVPSDSDNDSDASSDSNPYNLSDAAELSDAGDSNNGAPLSSRMLSDLNGESLHNAKGKQAASTSAWNTFAESERSSAKGKEFSGQDRSGNAHRVIHAPSVADTEDSRETTRSHQPTEKEIKQMTSKFAKIGTTPSKPIAPPEYVGGRAVDPDLDFDSDDSDDSYGYI